MIITLHNPTQRLHGKLHKSDPYYFRFHYGKQRLVYMQKDYVDRPTANQQASRQAFTDLRRKVARQLHNPTLRAKWEKRFKTNPQGYKMLHTYVYAQLKAGKTVTQSPYRPMAQLLHYMSTPHKMPQTRHFVPLAVKPVSPFCAILADEPIGECRMPHHNNE